MTLDNEDIQEPDRRWELRQRALKWLVSKEPLGFPCALCKENNWIVGDVSELRPFEGENGGSGGSIYPVFPVTCSNCGHMVLFNAIQAHVFDDEYDFEAGEPSDADVSNPTDPDDEFVE